MHRILLLAALLLPLPLVGQAFRVDAHLGSDTLGGRATLTILDGTQRRPQYSARVRQGQCTLQGTLLRPQPYWAQLSHPSLPQPIGFLLEPGNIRIQGTRVSGSESHSQWAAISQSDPHAFARQNPDHILTPTLLYQHPLPYPQLRPLFDSLRGPALASSHYPLLRQLLQQMALSSEGATLPDSLRRPAQPTLLLFTAPWCHPCQTAADSLAHLHPLLLDVEQDPTLWDRFALPHIPFLLLADSSGTILQRDLRWWEISK